MRRLVLAIGLLVLFWSTSSAEAACSGSGATRTCTAGSTASDIISAISSVTDPGTITLQNGSYTISSNVNFPMTKSITLICESVGGCTLGGSGTIGMNSTCNGTSTKLYRVSGFTFTVSNQHRIDFNASGSSGGCTITQFRLDHNTFSGGSTGARVIQLGGGDEMYLYGVIDHNTVTSANSIFFGEYFGPSLVEGPVGVRGTANNLFIEDNVITISTMTDSGASCFDSTGNPALVIRFNTSTNCRWATHGSTSSGSRNIEFYGNLVQVNAGSTGSGIEDCFRCYYNQGSGMQIMFRNAFTPYQGTINSTAMGVTHYRSASPTNAGYSDPPGQCDGTKARDGNRSPTTTYRGYPCWHQPGRDVDGSLQPMYAWQNYSTTTNAKVDLWVGTVHSGTNYFTNQFVDQRDYYNAVSSSAQTSSTTPFDGSRGVGFGTLSNRPTTCSVGLTDAADAGNGGVAYWATDQGSWNTSSSNPNGVQFNGADGILYRCGATNTWTVHYVPYTYPHPLQVGGLAVGDTTPPAAPANLRIQ